MSTTTIDEFLNRSGEFGTTDVGLAVDVLGDLSDINEGLGELFSLGLWDIFILFFRPLFISFILFGRLY
jgi:hypothetical protein